MFDFKISLYVFESVLILSCVAVFMVDFGYSLYSLALKEIDFLIPCVIHLVFRFLFKFYYFRCKLRILKYYELYCNFYWGPH